RDRALAELAEHSDSALRAAAEHEAAALAAVHQTRLFRYTAAPRRVYYRLRGHGGAANVPPPEQAPEEPPPPEQAREDLTSPEHPPELIRYWLDNPAAEQTVDSDLLLPVNGWAFC